MRSGAGRTAPQWGGITQQTVALARLGAPWRTTQAGLGSLRSRGIGVRKRNGAAAAVSGVPLFRLAWRRASFVEVDASRRASAKVAPICIRAVLSNIFLS